MKYCVHGFEICNVEGSLKGEKEKQKVEAFRYCLKKQRVWKLPTFLFYRFLATAAYLISFLPLFISRLFINADRTSLLWLRYLYISILFLGTKLLFSVSILFFFLGAKLLCSIYINMRRFLFFILLFFSFVCVCVYIIWASLAASHHRCSGWWAR